MLLISLLLLPIFGIFAISLIPTSNHSTSETKRAKVIALSVSTVNLFISLIVFILFHFSSNQFQFVQEYHRISNFDFYLGVDGISIYFVLLTTIIMPISLLSNWSSISENVKSYLVIILLLETLLLAVFLVLDILLFYIFFESILPPLFLLIGIFGSSNRVRASFYLFLYTLLGSLFLLLSILTMSSIMGTTDFDALYKTNFTFYTQIFLFCGIFIAFAVKTPTIFLNTWLLKAHVESPLGGSIILAGIVLKLSLYGILRLILPLIPKGYMFFTPIIYVIGVITIIYASFSTLRTIDIKELIAYSSVSHAAVYLLGVFSNTIQGIEGGILLGLAHGFVSSGLFICAGGVLYDRSSTRLITFYRGIAQVMPIFSILFFILCLGNAGTPLSLNFIGEFMSLYGTFERLPLLGIFASSSIVFSAAYTIYMFNRIAFAGPFSKFFKFNLPDLSRREFAILVMLVILTILFGIYPAPLLDGLHYSVSSLIYTGDLQYLLFGPFFATSRLNYSDSKNKEGNTVFKLSFLTIPIIFILWFIFVVVSVILILLCNVYEKVYTIVLWGNKYYLSLQLKNGQGLDYAVHPTLASGGVVPIKFSRLWITVCIVIILLFIFFIITFRSYHSRAPSFSDFSIVVKICFAFGIMILGLISFGVSSHYDLDAGFNFFLAITVVPIVLWKMTMRCYAQLITLREFWRANFSDNPRLLKWAHFFFVGFVAKMSLGNLGHWCLVFALYIAKYHLGIDDLPVLESYRISKSVCHFFCCISLSGLFTFYFYTYLRWNKFKFSSREVLCYKYIVCVSLAILIFIFSWYGLSDFCTLISGDTNRIIMTANLPAWLSNLYSTHLSLHYMCMLHIGVSMLGGKLCAGIVLTNMVNYFLDNNSEWFSKKSSWFVLLFAVLSTMWRFFEIILGLFFK